ncbi:MAG: Gfo/Idh/MocA family oxidoreductase [Anaerolineae bacterium]|nr:Gfo/Idh/MocA family oxidoreductase [Anaerolineae bacterium]
MRLGILSFAHLHAESYLTILLKMADVEVVGIADENIERGQYFAKQFGVKLFESYAKLLAEKPDAVIVCSENARHLPLVQMAAEAGAHILCEKPLATNIEDAKAIVDICQQAGVQLMTAFPMRFGAAGIEVKRLMESHTLGQVYGCNATNQGSLPELHQAQNLAFLKRDWFVDKQLAGGGALADHVVHLADLLRWYLEAEVTEVYAATNRIIHGDRVNVETGGLVMLTFANGTFASIDCSWSKPASYPTWGGLKFELVGENGLVTLDAYKQVLSVYSERAGKPLWNYWGSDANAGMLREFVDAVKANRTPSITGTDGLRAVEIVVAAYQSVEAGQPVRIESSMH